MNKNNPKIEGPFAFGGGRCPEYLNKCGSCGKIIGKETNSLDGEYRRTLNEELFNKTGGLEGRIYYCVPCGERIEKTEAEQERRENERIRNEKKQNAKKVIADCLGEISSLEQKLTSESVVGAVEDYKKIKNVEKRIKKLDNFEETKGDIEKLKNSCRDLIDNYFSPKIRKISNSKIGHVIHSICCLPKNFKLDENNQFYCDYCWETGDYWEEKSSSFLRNLKSYHIDKLNKMMLDNGVSVAELNSSNYHQLLTVPDMILTQKGIRDTFQLTEQDLQTFLKEKKGISITTSRERERERERNRTQQSQLRSQIMNLEQTPNRTAEQEDQLAAKKKELEELEKKIKDLEKQNKPQEQKPTKNKPWGLIIGGSVAGVVGLVVLALVIKKNKKSK